VSAPVTILFPATRSPRPVPRDPFPAAHSPEMPGFNA
jgi:hypothetical protein